MAPVRREDRGAAACSEDGKGQRRRQRQQLLVSAATTNRGGKTSGRSASFSPRKGPRTHLRPHPRCLARSRRTSSTRSTFRCCPGRSSALPPWCTSSHTRRTYPSRASSTKARRRHHLPRRLCESRPLCESRQPCGSRGKRLPTSPLLLLRGRRRPRRRCRLRRSNSSSSMSRSRRRRRR